MNAPGLVTRTHNGGPFPLEVIDGPPVAEGSRRVVFVHGICHGAWCWRNYMHALADHQIASTAVSLRGHAGSGGHDQLDEFGLEDYVDDVLSVVGSDAAKTIVVGHSMGGAIVQLALQRPGVEFAGAVLLTPMVPGGHNRVEMARLMLSIRSYLNVQKIVGGKQLSAEKTNRTAFFDGRLTADDAAWAASNLQAESKRAMVDLESFEPPAGPLRTPTYVLGSSKDTIFRASTLHRTAEHYGLQADVLSEGCHDLMIDPTWQVSANRLIQWIKNLTTEN